MNPPPHKPSRQPQKTFEFRLTRRVEFCETDMAGIMHFSNYFRLMEAAETAFYRSLGLSALLAGRRSDICLPRVHAECDYNDPLRFDEEVLVHLLVERKGKRSLTYQFRFFRVGDGQARQVARGKVVAASVARQKGGTLQAVPLPEELAERIQQAPAEVLDDIAELERQVASGSPTTPLNGSAKQADLHQRSTRGLQKGSHEAKAPA